MRILPKNLLKFISLSNRPPFPIPKGQHIFQPAAAAKNNHGFLLRRLRWSSLDEDKIFSDISSKTFSSSSIDSQELQSFWGTVTNYYTALSPDNFSPLETPNFPHFNHYSVRGSCGGVVCLDNGTRPEDVVFWNPTTNEVKFLPQTDEERPLPEEIHPLRMFTHVNAAGFGFDSKSQDYKYVRWVTFFYEEEDDCGFWRYEGYSEFPEMYSLKSDSWKIIHCPYHRLISGNATAFMNGLYWSLFTRPRQIMRFDLATEEFTFFPFPHTRKQLGGTHLCKVFDFGGRLVVVLYPTTEIKQFDDSSRESSFELWVWNGGWWSKEFDDCIEGCHVPLGFSQDARLMFLVGIDCLLHVFDIRTKNLKKCDIYCNPHQCDLIPYVESTFPLHGT